jgi:putative oxidoreductase
MLPTMRHFYLISGLLLGLGFVAFGLMFLLKLVPPPPAPPEGSLPALFMGAFVPSGYLTFVKVCEVVGGVLVAIPLTRCLGLLVLGPILINIIAFHVYITSPAELLNPVMIVLVALTLVLLWAERRAFAGLISRPR